MQRHPIIGTRLALGLVVLFSMMLSGCGGPKFEATLDIAPGELVAKRVERYSEWRDAQRIVPDVGRAVLLGTVQSGDLLRIGALEEEGMRGRLHVFAGERRLDTIVLGESPRWRDYQHTFTSEQAALGPCRILYEGQSALWCGPLEIYRPNAMPPANVLVILVDTLRLDHLSAYGYERQTSPNLDAFARDAVRFNHLTPSSSWTKPSVASLLTGTYPNTHGGQDRPDVLRDGLPSFARALKTSGRATHGFMTNINCLPLWGFGNDFDRYVDVDSKNWLVSSDDARVVDRAIATAAAYAGQPWFLYVHTMGPHDPYVPPGKYRTQFQREEYSTDPVQAENEREIDLYDGEIAYTDEQLGRLFAALKATGAYDKTLIVVLSDHGEEFREHGQTRHAKTLYEEMLRIPLLIKLPNSAHAGEVRDQLVEMVDVAPTVLDLLGIPPPHGFEGRSFRAVIEENAPGREQVYASLLDEAYSLRTAKTATQKYIRDLASQTELYFELDTDPREKAPLPDEPDWAALLKAHATKMGARNASGLHFLITCGPEPRTVEVEIEAENLGVPELRYYEWKGRVEQAGSTVRLEMRTHDAQDVGLQRTRWHGELAEQDNAHLVVPCPPDSALAIRIRVDGQPAAAGTVRGGADQSPLALDAPVAAMSLTAANDDYDVSALPRAFGLYAWYVPTPDDIRPESLDAESTETLKALGYLE